MVSKGAMFDEMTGFEPGTTGNCREPYKDYQNWINAEDPSRLRKKSSEAEAFFRRTGITFNVYGAAEAAERLIPFDLIPRIISAREWAKLERGIKQRIQAINAFLHDIYHRQEILRAGRIPVELIANNEAFLPQMIGVTPQAMFIPILWEPILCALPRMNFMFWKTMHAHPPAFPICWKIGKQCCICFRNYFPG